MVETRFMGIDFGKKRVGISLSDPLKTFAYSFTAVQNNTNLFNELSKIISEKSITRIILGIPNEGRMSATSVVKDVMKFKADLEEKFYLKVILWDETYTSVIASNKILESVGSKTKRRDKGLIDMNAAAIILQEYLDTNKSND